jgi:hypothetical protein
LQMVQPLGLINSGIQKSYMMVIPFTVWINLIQTILTRTIIFDISTPKPRSYLTTYHIHEIWKQMVHYIGFILPQKNIGFYILYHYTHNRI